MFPDRVAQALRSGAAAALLAALGGTAEIALAQSPRVPPAKPPVTTGRPADQELDSVRDEQRKSIETQQRLTT
jgi:hypothetical protein